MSRSGRDEKPRNQAHRGLLQYRNGRTGADPFEVSLRVLWSFAVLDLAEKLDLSENRVAVGDSSCNSLTQGVLRCDIDLLVRTIRTNRTRTLQTPAQS